ncbi:glycosyl transferase group 1 [Pleurocapsa sp. CCALA 161]|uniref:glycosyltransferase family 4 protein n=1 Tax=Pleurocapsa sp. CCALA 161 TaxID=2107688 RepID=UPI000D052059|nr:glycosyltransferase family 1 protein [Pleurocapsa sp. CCALA 161]PSB06680.1 glycosyl transferase group 1 [Pleurocapsa sp. CCALA 161]
MRIAIVRREPKVAFSMDVYTDNLVVELKKLRPDWEILEIAPQPWSKNLENLWHTGNPIRKYYERFYHHPQAVKQVDADLFHIIDHSDAHIAYGLKKIGKPVVVTCHDLVQFIYPEIMKNQARFPAFSLAVWQYCVKGITVADSIIAVSSNTAKDVAHWLNISPAKIEIVPNGVDTVFNIPDKKTVTDWKQQYAKSPDEICLLHVGSNQQRKNIETVLKVIKAIAEQGIPVRLWKVGGDFHLEQEQYIKANNLSPHITFVSNPEREAVINFYCAADALVAPSLYEGFGLTVLEAMACGTPTITSNVSAIPEVVGDAAVLVEPTDVAAITEAVLRINRDRDFRQDLIDRGFARIKEFSWKKTAEKTAQLYEQVVQSKNAILAD